MPFSARWDVNVVVSNRVWQIVLKFFLGQPSIKLSARVCRVARFSTGMSSSSEKLTGSSFTSMVFSLPWTGCGGCYFLGQVGWLA